MSDVTPPGVGATITVGDFELSSSSETAEQMREAVKSVRPIKGRPGDRAKDAETIETTHVDEGGKSHDAAGKFKGNGEAKEPDTLDAAAVAKKEKDKESEAERKKTAQSRIHDLATKKNEEAKAREAAERRAEVAERRAAEAEAKLRVPREPEAKIEPPKPKEGKGESPKRKFPLELQDFGPPEEVETWTKYNEARDEWVIEEAEKAAEARYAKRVEGETREKQQAERSERLNVQSEAADAAFKARGPEWAASVKDVTDRLVPRMLVPEGQPVTAMNGLADYVILHGEKIPEVLEFLRDNPEHIQAFEEIVRSPPERQPFLFERELGILYGSLKSVLKASATAGTPEPRALPEPRAKPPVPPVAGSPNAVEADLSKVSDLDEYVRKLPADRRAQILRRR